MNMYLRYLSKETEAIYGRVGCALISLIVPVDPLKLKTVLKSEVKYNVMEI